MAWVGFVFSISLMVGLPSAYDQHDRQTTKCVNTPPPLVLVWSY
jgi:hypothetical protein